MGALPLVWAECQRWHAMHIQAITLEALTTLTGSVVLYALVCDFAVQYNSPPVL